MNISDLIERFVQLSLTVREGHGPIYSEYIDAKRQLDEAINELIATHINNVGLGRLTEEENK